MVDTPVGKKCKDCARNRTHIDTSDPLHVTLAFVVATLVAFPAWFVLHSLFIWFGWVIYGTAVGEVALRVGKRRRSLAMQVAAGMAAFLGTTPQLGHALWLLLHMADAGPEAQIGLGMVIGWPLVGAVVGIVIAVSRVRYW